MSQDIFILESDPDYMYYSPSFLFTDAKLDRGHTVLLKGTSSMILSLDPFRLVLKISPLRINCSYVSPLLLGEVFFQRENTFLRGFDGNSGKKKKQKTSKKMSYKNDDMKAF